MSTCVNLSPVPRLSIISCFVVVCLSRNVPICYFYWYWFEQHFVALAIIFALVKINSNFCNSCGRLCRDQCLWIDVCVACCYISCVSLSPFVASILSWDQYQRIKAMCCPSALDTAIVQVSLHWQAINDLLLSISMVLQDLECTCGPKVWSYNPDFWCFVGWCSKYFKAGRYHPK